jgi:hypothetical protein
MKCLWDAPAFSWKSWIFQKKDTAYFFFSPDCKKIANLPYPNPYSGDSWQSTTQKSETENQDTKSVYNVSRGHCIDAHMRKPRFLGPSTLSWIRVPNRRTTKTFIFSSISKRPNQMPSAFSLQNFVWSSSRQKVPESYISAAEPRSSIFLYCRT